MAPLPLALSTALICAIHMLFIPSAESFTPPRIHARGAARVQSPLAAQKVDLCIIGGGISGLAAAITAGERSAQRLAKSDSSTSETPLSILLLESDSAAAGGRVRSDVTDDGFILDRGFAVFIEEYPRSKELLDYEALGLKQFLPGARVKLPGKTGLAVVSDPLRRPRDIFRVLASPVGSPIDKLRLLPLFYAAIIKNIEDLFAMEETDTLACLRNKYRFSEEFISSFFAPFLEGIYLTSLENQSSRMLHFVMQMFTVGSTSLPMGGMQAVSNQLENKAKKLGVKIQLGSKAVSVERVGSEDAKGEYDVLVDTKEHGQQTICAKSVVIATDVDVAKDLLNGLLGLEQIDQFPSLPQRSVGCIYYAFQSPAPLSEPVLILNGEGEQRRNTKVFPINNVCFPSVVQTAYAPDGWELCSVSILENVLAEYARDHDSLDNAVRKHLSAWFPDYACNILDESKWIHKGMYLIPNAQPCHYGKDGCASINGGRDCSVFQGVAIPGGVFVCGDHMATSTFNGALESGINAGGAAETFSAETK